VNAAERLAAIAKALEDAQVSTFNAKLAFEAGDYTGAETGAAYHANMARDHLRRAAKLCGEM
jgi:hypothetical protein